MSEPAVRKHRGLGRRAGNAGQGTSRTGPAVRRRPRTAQLAWLGVVPFLLFVAVFLGVPLFEIIKGSFQTQSGKFTFSNFHDVFTQSQYTTALKNSLIFSAWTAAGPAILGLWFAAAVAKSKPGGMIQRIVTSCSGVLAYFAGEPLAFIFVATFGTLGVLTGILHSLFGFDLSDHFTIASLVGVGLCYFYFQIPLMVILITPAVEGLRPEWEDAALNLGASRFSYLRLVVFPVLMPSLVGATLMLFGSALSAYATMLALSAGTLATLPGKINFALTNNVLPGQTQIAEALGTEMILLVVIIMVLYWFVQKRAGKWMK